MIENPISHFMYITKQARVEIIISLYIDFVQTFALRDVTKFPYITVSLLNKHLI